jgi:hypothetical protein
VKIRLTLEISRSPRPEPEQHEHRDTDSYVENAAPRMVGFTPEEDRLASLHNEMARAGVL